MTHNLEIIIGTYEEFLLGYKWDEEKGTLSQSFADKSHTGAIKCLAVCGKYIASGGSDDRIFIYNMQSRKQSQILLSHEGSINAIAFTPEQTHIISGGDDGRMIAVRLNTWQVEATWKKAHKGLAVTHVSCHPSGKLALSLGKDRILRTWNLIKGRLSYKTNLKSRSLGFFPDCLSWSPTGDYFTLAGPRVVEIWSIKKADVWKFEKTFSKPICLAWVNESSVVVGLEDGKIIWLSVDQHEKSISFDGHQSRVKAMCFQFEVLATASSSGEIKLWNINDNEKTLTELVSTNIGCRPTCIGILELDQFGSDYVLLKDRKEEKQNVTKVECNPNTPQEKGMVIIEYDDDNKSESSDKEDNMSNECRSGLSPTKNKRQKRYNNSEWIVTKISNTEGEKKCTNPGRGKKKIIGGKEINTKQSAGKLERVRKKHV